MALGLVGSCVCDVAQREEAIETFERWEGRLGGRREGAGARAGTVAVVWNAGKNFGTTGSRTKRVNATTRVLAFFVPLGELRLDRRFGLEARFIVCYFFLNDLFRK